jgi:hypothetical protein
MSSQLDRLTSCGYRVTLCQASEDKKLLIISKPGKGMVCADGEWATFHIIAPTCEQAVNEALKMLGEAVCAS